MIGVYAPTQTRELPTEMVTKASLLKVRGSLTFHTSPFMSRHTYKFGVSLLHTSLYYHINLHLPLVQSIVGQHGKPND